MKYLKFVTFLFIIYETSFYLVKGQTSNKEKNDCTKLMNFINNDVLNYDDNRCCLHKSGIKCENEYITFLDTSGYDIQDFTYFPYLLKIEELIIKKKDLNEIPNSILKLTTLKHLDLNNNKIKKIPNEMSNLGSLEFLDISHNQIEVIPSIIQILTNLVYLNLSDNEITEIPPEIQNLSKLKNLFLSNNKLRELPYEIFDLNLKSIDLHNNENLSTTLIKFSNSTLEECNFSNINILCYQPDICKLHKDNKNKKDDGYMSDFKKCTDSEINKIISQIRKKKDLKPDNSNINNNKKSKTSFIIIGGIIIGCIVFALIAFMLIKKRSSKKHNKSKFRSSGNFRSESIKFLLNKKSSKNDDNDDDNNIKNKVKPNKLNTNILIKSNSYHSPTKYVEPVLINTQNNGSYVPLFNNDNLNLNLGPLNIQNLLHSYDKTNMKKHDDKNI